MFSFLEGRVMNMHFLLLRQLSLRKLQKFICLLMKLKKNRYVNWALSFIIIDLVWGQVLHCAAARFLSGFSCPSRVKPQTWLLFPRCVKFEAQTALSLSLSLSLHYAELVIPEQTEIRDKPSIVQEQEYLRLQCTLLEHCTDALCVLSLFCAAHIRLGLSGTSWTADMTKIAMY